MSDCLAPYATHWRNSRGRQHSEPESRNRTPFQRDRDRIIHSTAFRRLKHKTQVFVSPEGDHYRTRLTHSIEVAQIARDIARSLHLDEDLAECLALAHDLGHPPFGHAGEQALDEVMRPWGGFDHNDQALRIMVRLEQRYAEFDGLNPTWETLEGVVKHNGPLNEPTPSIADFNAVFDLELATWPGPEAQVAAIADDIAYDHHDLDDGLRAGFFTIRELDAVPHVAAVFSDVRGRYPEIEQSRIIHESVRRLIDAMAGDVLAESRRRIGAANPSRVEDIRALHDAVIAFSPAMRENDRALKAFLFANLYRQEPVVSETREAGRIVRELFAGLMAVPERLPPEWRPAGDAQGAGLARIVADYIAGMTDRYAQQKHAGLSYQAQEK